MLPRPPDKPKPLFSLASGAQQIQAGVDRRGAIAVRVEFETAEVEDPKKAGDKAQKQLADEVFIEIANGVVDSAATIAANLGSVCFVTSATPWKVTKDCTLEIHLQSLVAGQVVSVTGFRKEGKKKVAADPVSIEIH